MKLQAQSMSFRMQIMMLDLSKTALLSTRCVYCVRLHMLTNRILYKCLSSFVCLFHFLVAVCVSSEPLLYYGYFFLVLLYTMCMRCVDKQIIIFA